MSKRILHLLSGHIEPAARSRLIGLLRAPRDDRFEVHTARLARKHSSAKSDSFDDQLPLHVQRHTIDTPWTIDPRACWRLARHLAQLQPDLIHYWDTAAAAYGLLAGRGANRCVATVVESTAIVSSNSPLTMGATAGLPSSAETKQPPEHCWTSQQWHPMSQTLFFQRATRGPAPGGWLARQVRRAAIRRMAAVVTWSETSCGQCASADVPADQIRLIARGAEPFESSPTADDLRESLQIPSDARVIAAFGPERPGVNLKDVIWAFDLVQLIRDEAHLIIIGAGPRGGLLKQFRDDLSLGTRVHFVDRPLACPEVGRLMAQNVDVVWSADVCPAVARWLPRSLASGIPVIAIEGHEASEMIESGLAGYLLAPGDRAGYARITDKLLDDGALHQQISQAASKLMRERYSVQTMIEGHLMLYEELLGKGDYLSQKSFSADPKQI